MIVGELPIWDSFYDKQPIKCVGCECSGRDIDWTKREFQWICELQEQGEPCYMGDDSYNPWWHWNNFLSNLTDKSRSKKDTTSPPQAEVV